MTDPVPNADEAARAAAAAARITLRDAPAMSTTERGDLARLFDEIWGRDVAAQGSIISAEILWATSHAGAQVTAAFRDGELVGGTATFLGRDRDGLLLHSHLTGVVPAVLGQGVGRALKLHQRAWCLGRGIRKAVWTFDPLVRRNAVFNLTRLGARPVAFYEDLYGPMADERNVGLPTDRFYVEWQLDRARAIQAAAGRRAEPRLDGLRRSGAVEVLRVGADGSPEPTGNRGRLLLAQIPADIEALRREDPAVAARWPAAFRSTVGTALDEGATVTGITGDGWYVVAHDKQVAELR